MKGGPRRGTGFESWHSVHVGGIAHAWGLEAGRPGLRVSEWATGMEAERHTGMAVSVHVVGTNLLSPGHVQPVI